MNQHQNCCQCASHFVTTFPLRLIARQLLAASSSLSSQWHLSASCLSYDCCKHPWGVLFGYTELTADSRQSLHYSSSLKPQYFFHHLVQRWIMIQLVTSPWFENRPRAMAKKHWLFFSRLASRYSSHAAKGQATLNFLYCSFYLLLEICDRIYVSCELSSPSEIQRFPFSAYHCLDSDSTHHQGFHSSLSLVLAVC